MTSKSYIKGTPHTIPNFLNFVKFSLHQFEFNIQVFALLFSFINIL